MVPNLSFSDCGTFAYIASVLGGDRLWYQIVHRVDIPSAAPRFIEISLSFNSSFTIFHGLDSASAKLELIKIPDNGFWARKNEPRVVLGDVAAYSSQLTDSQTFLLLGAEDHAKMRLLIVPSDGRTPIIKTLPLTFAEARVRLEKEWQRQHAKSQEQDLSKAV
ncbi:MAG: hypothetical protein ALECFALPRED_004200 [Alectoria fallacina]|uniref:Uncharacterized protein n=1 Tax=Alectoria fallacina TaxID=1903189 RepID=A0A8H3HYR1_9LECA|nr:MAG: hypothetical protein ALECFALPRED_004200 [Alectoria fallacina]